MISYEKRKKRKVNNVRSRDVFVRFSREFLKGKKSNIIQYSIKLVKKVMFFLFALRFTSKSLSAERDDGK